MTVDWRLGGRNCHQSTANWKLGGRDCHRTTVNRRLGGRGCHQTTVDWRLGGRHCHPLTANWRLGGRDCHQMSVDWRLGRAPATSLTVISIERWPWACRNGRFDPRSVRIVFPRRKVASGGIKSVAAAPSPKAKPRSTASTTSTAATNTSTTSSPRSARMWSGCGGEWLTTQAQRLRRAAQPVRKGGGGRSAGGSTGCDSRSRSLQRLVRRRWFEIMGHGSFGLELRIRARN